MKAVAVWAEALTEVGVLTWEPELRCSVNQDRDRRLGAGFSSSPLLPEHWGVEHQGSSGVKRYPGHFCV